MAEPLLRELNRLRALILDPEVLVKTVASGRQKGEQPTWRRAEMRYVDLKAGRHLQITTFDDTQAFTANHAVGDAARDAVVLADGMSCRVQLDDLAGTPTMHLAELLASRVP